MKNKDNGLDELLALLRANPELIKELIFDPANVKRLLKSEAARELVIGQDTEAFLRYIAGPDDGYPIAQCLKQTKYLCAKGTRHVACGGGTKSSK